MNNIDKKMKRDRITLKDVIITILIALTIVFIAKQFYITTTVTGSSMESSFYDKEKLLLDVNAYKRENPKFGDVIVFERDDLSQKYFIKRVIGIGGDKLKIKNNKLYINNKLINEDYIKEEMLTDDIEVTIPEGKIFAMGDNRNNSIDSRSYIIGFVDIEDEILGKAVFNLSKFNKIDG